LRAVTNEARRNQGLQELRTRIAELQVRAIERRSSDGGELRRRAVVTGRGEETEEEEKTKTTAMIVYIRRRRRPHDDVWHVANMLKPELAVKGTPGRCSKLAGVGREVSPCCWPKFNLITKMPLLNFHKLL
jgi:hypothetical protein